MKKFIIERSLPGAGKLTADEINAIARTSMDVVAVLGKPYNWIGSYVTDDKIYCVHEAESEDVIRQHSSCAGFPVANVFEVMGEFGPANAIS